MAQRVVVTGACGFIGTCLSQRLKERGAEVIGIDNLCRKGSELNAAELAGPRFALHRVDLSNAQKTHAAFAAIGPVDAVFHLAAQVAVTTSYENRERDFQDNAVASFNVIESVKRFTPEAYALFASTNKVYGHLEVAKPVDMTYPLAPYTPYGISKAVGELYFTEYGRPEIGLTTCSLRQSCIYGHHQFGVEDQGWLAWFTIANMFGRPITIYGDGEQVRDLLFVDNLVDLYLACWEKGQTGIFPTGGGPDNAISLNQGLKLIEQATGKPFATVERGETRPGDQPYFVADISWPKSVGLDWRPTVGVEEGLRQMVAWITANSNKIKSTLGL